MFIESLPLVDQGRPATLVGQALPVLLAHFGIDTVFGIPGVHTVEMYRGLTEGTLRHVTPRHEQGAAFMADGYARISGRPAACFLITGPGLLNAGTAIAQAYADSIPMLVLSTVNSRSLSGIDEGRLHELRDQSAVMAGIAATSRHVTTCAQLHDALNDAFALFQGQRPRPVHIELPLDFIKSDYVGQLFVPDQKPLKAPQAALYDDAAHILNVAKRIAIVMGGGAAAASAAARDFVEKTGAVAFATANARGVLPPDHALNPGGFLPLKPARAILAEADVVVAIGTELAETDLDFYDGGPLEISGALIRIDVEGGQIDKRLDATLPLHGDSRVILPALVDRLAPASTQRRAWAEKAAQRNCSEGAAAAMPRIARHLPLYDAIWTALPNAAVFADSTEPGYAGNLAANAPRPRSYASAATGFGTLGYALPAAIGAKVGEPNRAIICVIGDGGILFTLTELAAAIEANAPIIVLLWNNACYGEIREYMRDVAMEPVAVELVTPDFQAIARGFGCHAEAVTSFEEVKSALIAAASRKCPSIIQMDEWSFNFDNGMAA